MKNFFDLNKTYYYIVDTSYVIFCAAAAAFKDYVYQEDISKELLGPEFDPTLDQEFNYIFTKKFQFRIENPIKNIVPYSFNKSNFIFSLDCPRKEIWRRTVFPEYKLPRDIADHSKDQFNLGKCFSYAYSNIIPNYCDQNGSTIINTMSAESDDIIAILTKYILNKNENNKVIILSSDRDMVQLFNDRTLILTTQNEIRNPSKELSTMTKINNLPENLTANDFLLFKILIGDGSDNIPSVKYRMGPKTAIQFVLDKSRKKLKQLFLEDSNIISNFKRNKQLISMNEIPVELQDLIVENIDKMFNDKQNNNVKESNIDDIINEML